MITTICSTASDTQHLYWCPKMISPLMSIYVWGMCANVWEQAFVRVLVSVRSISVCMHELSGAKLKKKTKQCENGALQILWICGPRRHLSHRISFQLGNIDEQSIIKGRSVSIATLNNLKLRVYTKISILMSISIFPSSFYLTHWHNKFRHLPFFFSADADPRFTMSWLINEDQCRADSDTIHF